MIAIQSLEWRPLAGCAGKVAYVTAGKAHETLKFLQRRHFLRHGHSDTGETLKPYRCHFCGCYHLGNSG